MQAHTLSLPVSTYTLSVYASPHRDWFQLTLKEGLTVFRDQTFSGDMNSAPVKRIEDVSILRASQFTEDAGPMSHPIRPDRCV